jgi:IMP dehydrogenase
MWTSTVTTSPRTALTFDDVQIIPQYSEVESRSNVDTSTQVSVNYDIQIPLIAAPMDTVCDGNMASVIAKLGGLGVIHRFMTIEEQANQAQFVRLICSNLEYPVAAAIGANGDAVERAQELVKNGVNVLVIDVAHGHHRHVKNTITKLKSSGIKADIIAGSIATVQAARDLVEWGADGLRVGVGGGSVCETRVRTGVGVPQLQAIVDTAYEVDVPVISDGGIRYPGDAAKALAAGADTVMIGSLFAGTDEAPGEVFVDGQWPNVRHMKIYRGLASATSKLLHKGAAEHVEGASKMVPSRGSVSTVVSDIMDGIKSSMSYVGAHNLDSFRDRAVFERITAAGLNEAHPHLLR